MTNKEAKTFAENVKKERKKLGWSQETLALEAGVSRNTITNIEKVHTEVSSDSMIKIARALDKEINYLLGSETEHRKLSTSEQEILKIFRSIPDNKKSDCLKMIQLFANACE